MNRSTKLRRGLEEAALAGLLVLMAAVIAIDLGLKRLDRRFSYWKPVR